MDAIQGAPGVCMCVCVCACVCVCVCMCVCVCVHVCVLCGGGGGALLRRAVAERARAAGALAGCTDAAEPRSTRPAARTRHGPAHGADRVPHVGLRDRARRARLCEPVALQHRRAHRARQHLLHVHGQRRRAGEDEAHAAAQARLDLVEHDAVHQRACLRAARVCARGCVGHAGVCRRGHVGTRARARVCSRLRARQAAAARPPCRGAGPASSSRPCSAWPC
jgi:hypothetical protein